MLRILLGILIALIGGQSQAGADEVYVEEPRPDSTVGLTPKCEQHLCGYIDGKGDFKISRIYKRAMPFYEGRASVYKEGEGWGVIDPEGNYIVKPSFAWIGPFSEGLAAAQVSERYLYHWAYIDRSGSIAIDFKFKVAERFPSTRAKLGLVAPTCLPNRKSRSTEPAKCFRLLCRDNS